MGFYIHITLHSSISKETGKPIYYNSKGEETDDISNVEPVPLEYRRFLHEKGRWFTMYTSNYIMVEENPGWIDYPSNICDNFPTWDAVKDYLEDAEADSEKDYLSYWKEEDHNLLHEAMKWFANQKNHYQVHWG